MNTDGINGNHEPKPKQEYTRIEKRELHAMLAQLYDLRITLENIDQEMCAKIVERMEIISREHKAAASSKSGSFGDHGQPDEEHRELIGGLSCDVRELIRQVGMIYERLLQDNGYNG